jgi:hypothetical protein
MFCLLCETWDSKPPSPQDLEIHTHPVTSDLASRKKSAHHDRGEGSIGK